MPARRSKRTGIVIKIRKVVHLKKKSELSRLMDYAGSYRYFTYASWILAAASALLALGCHLCRSCHSGLCNWGIATQLSLIHI